MFLEHKNTRKKSMRKKAWRAQLVTSYNSIKYCNFKSGIVINDDVLRQLQKSANTKIELSKLRKK